MIIRIVLFLACISYLVLDLYLEYKNDMEKLHEETQRLIKEQEEESLNNYKNYCKDKKNNTCCSCYSCSSL